MINITYGDRRYQVWVYEWVNGTYKATIYHNRYAAENGREVAETRPCKSRRAACLSALGWILSDLPDDDFRKS